MISTSDLVELQPHPATPTQRVRGIEVAMDFQTPDVLDLRYCVSADPGDVRIPASQKPAARDELWRHTCFEVFISVDQGPAYREFNLSPSREWAAYGFEAYRQGAKTLTIADPVIECYESADGFCLRARLACPDIPNRPGRRLSLTAVIEDRDGKLSYWALRHVADKPDFHQLDSFLLEPDRR